MQPILEEFNSPSEPAVPSTQKGQVRICPSQHFSPGLVHQGGPSSISPACSLLTDQQSPSSQKMLYPFPNYCHSPRHVLWETPFSTIQGSSPCSNWRITFGLENRIPVHEQEREWIHGADVSGQSDTQIQPQSLGQRDSWEERDLFWEGFKIGLPEDGQEVVSGRKLGLWLCTPLSWNLLWDPEGQSSGDRRQEKHREDAHHQFYQAKTCPGGQGQ